MPPLSFSQQAFLLWPLTQSGFSSSFLFIALSLHSKGNAAISTVKVKLLELQSKPAIS